MKTCPNCQQAMDDNLAFCMNCGTQLPAGQPAPAPQPSTSLDGRRANFLNYYKKTFALHSISLTNLPKKSIIILCAFY